MIHAVAEKWGGEPGEMFSIASRAAGNAESNSPLVGILAEAHVEQWLYLGMCDKEEQMTIYFRKPSVREDLVDAYSKIHNVDIDSYEMITALNNFAFCFYLCGMNELAKEVLTKVNGRFIEHPWDYLNETFLANLHTGYTIDKVLKSLDVVSTDMPEVIVKNKQGCSSEKVAASDATEIDVAEDFFKRRVFKTPIIVPLSIACVILVYVGYPLLRLFDVEMSILEAIKGITFELFLLCNAGLFSLVLLSKKHLTAYLARYPIITDRESFDALKPIARTNMYSALMSLLFLCVGSLAAIMTIINFSWLTSITVVVMSLVTSMMFNAYNGLEQRIKQLECTEDKLEEELELILDCWMNKPFSNF